MHTNLPIATRLVSKLPNVGTTIFTVMSKLAADVGAINLSQGFPGFDCSPDLVALVEQYMRKGFNQYAPMTGVPALREALAQKTFETYNVAYDPDTEITVTSGATEAIFAAITAVIRPAMKFWSLNRLMTATFRLLN